MTNHPNRSNPQYPKKVLPLLDALDVADYLYNPDFQSTIRGNVIHNVMTMESVRYAMFVLRFAKERFEERHPKEIHNPILIRLVEKYASLHEVFNACRIEASNLSLSGMLPLKLKES